MISHRLWICALLLVVLLVGTASAATLSFSQFGTNATVDGNPLGGGTGYSDIKTSGDCTATTATELLICLGNATSGQVVYVPETTEINMTDVLTANVPSGVTLASNRGSLGSAGGRIFKIVGTGGSPYYFMINATGNNARVTGLRLEGPYKEQNGTYAEKVAILNRGFSGIVVDNNEIFGWSYAGIYTYSSNATLNAEGITTEEIGSGITNIHHNYIHHNQINGLGYGVSLNGGAHLVKGNAFAYNRHNAASSGITGSGYEASYNIVLNKSPYVAVQDFDVHSSGGISGEKLNIHHNTILSTYGASIHISGEPQQSAIISNNILTNNTISGSAFGCSVFKQTSGANITMIRNLVDGIYVGGDQICTYG